jgi:hypothetical protein
VARDRKHPQHVARAIHLAGLLFLYANYHVTIAAMETKKALGVDIGNVIINNRLNDPEVNKVDEAVYAAFPPSEGVFDSLKTLNDYFNGEVYLLSKCTEWAQGQILLWLKVHDFYTKTGVKENNVYFVRQRHEKDGVCRKLGITHFIDDRLEVLSHMVESTPNLILFQPDDVEVKEFEKFLPNVTVANNWTEVVEKIK